MANTGLGSGSMTVTRIEKVTSLRGLVSYQILGSKRKYVTKENVNINPKQNHVTFTQWRIFREWYKWECMGGTSDSLGWEDFKC